VTLFLLIRHGTTDALGHTLSGRTAGIPLNATGHAEVRTLATRLRHTPLDGIYSSPLERARETANAIAAPHRLNVSIREELNDFEFGAWTSLSFAELDHLPEFQRFNRQRSRVRPESGEHPLEVQMRVVFELERLADEQPRATLAIVSHCDPIRAAIAYFLGIPLDFSTRMEIATASLSMLDLTLNDAIVRTLNQTP
jgi:broad specificity phosphatase PhoE